MKPASAAAKAWERMFKILRLFCRTHGHGNVPPNPAPDSLSRWLAEQLQLQLAGQLPSEAFRRLDALGIFPESNKPGRAATEAENERRWEKKFKQLLAFKTKFGHPHVPATWKRDPSLGHWISMQRQRHRQGRLR